MLLEMLPRLTVVPIGSMVVTPPEVVQVAGRTTCEHANAPVGGIGLGSEGVGKVSACDNGTSALLSTVAEPFSVSAGMVGDPSTQLPIPVRGGDSEPST